MRLVMLTSEYPYGCEETFVHNEVWRTAEYFDELVIYNFHDVLGVNDARAVPNNVTVHSISGLRNNKVGLAKALLSPSVASEIAFDKSNFGYKVRADQLRGIAQYRQALKILLPRLLEEDAEDTIFYSYWLGYHAYALSALRESRPNMFAVARSHNVDCFISRQSSFFRRETLGGLDCIFPCSDAGTEEIRTRLLPLLKGRKPEVHTRYLGVDCPGSQNPKTEEGPFHIVSCSNIHDVKRIDLIIGALSLLAPRRIHWTHIGHGGQPSTREHIFAMADELLTRSDGITYEFLGQMPNQAVRDYYQDNHVDLFINASDYEGIPVSIMEAMSYGIACCARDVGGNRELVRTDTGILLASHVSSYDLKEAILGYMLLTEDEKTKLRESARLHVRKNFNNEVVYKAFAKDLIRRFEERQGR